MEIEQIKPLKKETHVKPWQWIFAGGILIVVIGLTAILLPFAATIMVKMLIATSLFMAALIHIVATRDLQQTKAIIFRLLTSFIYGFTGIMLTMFPVRAEVSLTLLLIIAFMITSAFKIALALYIWPAGHWIWLTFNGIICGSLAILIWKGLPGTAKWAIGLLVGIELLFSGWAVAMLAISRRNSTERS